MFNLFSGKSKEAKLEKKYKKVLEESFQLSTTNRAKSDEKRAEAEEILKELESIRSSK